jgi:hypothetical protein
VLRARLHDERARDRARHRAAKPGKPKAMLRLLRWVTGAT